MKAEEKSDRTNTEITNQKKSKKKLILSQKFKITSVAQANYIRRPVYEDNVTITAAFNLGAVSILFVSRSNSYEKWHQSTTCFTNAYREGIQQYSDPSSSKSHSSTMGDPSLYEIFTPTFSFVIMLLLIIF